MAKDLSVFNDLQDCVIVQTVVTRFSTFRPDFNTRTALLGFVGGQSGTVFL
jgi:hypothetical protein